MKPGPTLLRIYDLLCNIRKTLSATPLSPIRNQVSIPQTQGATLHAPHPWDSEMSLLLVHAGLRQGLQTKPKLGQVLVPAPVWLRSSSPLIQTLCLEASGVAKLGWWHLPGIPEVSHPPELPSAPNAQRSAAAAERSPGSPGA